jgi:hypothetical protein
MKFRPGQVIEVTEEELEEIKLHGLTELDARLQRGQTTHTADLKDSGKREQFTSGAVRDTSGNKPLLELIPGWANLAYGWIMEAGARKYAARNWEKGMPMSRYISSAKRHLEAYSLGFRDEPHLWQALWNIGGAIHTSILVYLGVYPAEFYDLPNHIGKEPAPVLGEFERSRIDAMLVTTKVTGPRPGDKSYPNGV